MNRTFRFSCLAGVIFPLFSVCASTTEQSANQSVLFNNFNELLNKIAPEITDIDVAIKKAQTAQTQGRTDNALFYYVKALQFSPKNIYVLEQIATLYQQTNQTEFALKIYQELVKINDNHLLANEILGLHDLKNHLHSQAKQHLQRVLAQDDNRWQAHNGLGIIADVNKEFILAITHYQKALSLHPNSAMLLNNIGYSYYLRGDNKTAKDYFNQALHFDSQYAAAIQNLALIEIKNQHYAAAISLLNQMMKPYESYNNVGYICLLKGDYEEAENYLRQAIDESPYYFSKAQENLEQLKFLRSHE
jgi:Flp pilus assembly protein TadD